MLSQLANVRKPTSWSDIGVSEFWDSGSERQDTRPQDSRNREVRSPKCKGRIPRGFVVGADFLKGK
jgi:hypothetical protein